MPAEKLVEQTSIVTWPLPGAVHRYQTDAREVNPGPGSGSPDSTPAPRLVPEAVAVAPLPRSWALAKASLAGAAPPDGVKLAISERAWLIVTSQVAVPEQSPDQPAKVWPEAGVAVRLTWVPAS